MFGQSLIHIKPRSAAKKLHLAFYFLCKRIRTDTVFPIERILESIWAKVQHEAVEFSSDHLTAMGLKIKVCMILP